MKSIRELREICQPKYKLAGSAIFAKLFRSFSIYITWLIVPTNISANQVTLMSFALSLVAGVLFVSTSPWLSVLGAGVLFLSTTFDFVDGEVARYKNATSLTGKYLDLMAHAIQWPFLLACVSFGVFNKFHDATIFAFGFSAAIFEAVGYLARWGITRTLVHDKMLESLTQQHGFWAEQPALQVSGATEARKGEETSRPFGPLAVAVYLMRRFWYGEYYDVLLIAAGLLRPWVPEFRIGPLALDLMYLIVLFYGINRPLVCMAHIAWRTGGGSPDHVYQAELVRIMQARANDRGKEKGSD